MKKNRMESKDTEQKRITRNRTQINEMQWN